MSSLPRCCQNDVALQYQHKRYRLESAGFGVTDACRASGPAVAGSIHWAPLPTSPSSAHALASRAGQVDHVWNLVATLHLIVGLPCSGKTTLARQLERQYSALRLTPDEWHIRLF